MAGKGEVVAAVDFGNYAIRVLIGRRAPDGMTKILGYGSALSHDCVNYGAIQDADAASQAFRSALREAKRMANERIFAVYCGIQGATIKSTMHEGKVQVDNEIVKAEHLIKARENAALSYPGPDSRPISCTMSEEWSVDDMRVADPLDMRGSVLKGRIRFTQLSVFLENNLRACIEGQSLDIADFVFTPLAAAYGCLTREDKNIGAAVINLGASCTGIAVYQNGSIVEASAHNWGSGLIINDVAAGLKVSFEEATELVVDYGINLQLHEEKTKGAAAKTAGGDGNVQIKLARTVTGAPSTIQKSFLDHIIYERSDELADQICTFLNDKKLLYSLPRGIVLTGGGASIVNQDILINLKSGVDTRIGVPTGFDEVPEPMDAPEWTTVTGILNYAFAHRRSNRKGFSGTAYKTDNSTLAAVRRFVERFVV
jgi:cell division protein FtsA